MEGSFFRHLDSWQVQLEKLQTENVQTVGFSDESEWNRWLQSLEFRSPYLIGCDGYPLVIHQVAPMAQNFNIFSALVGDRIPAKTKGEQSNYDGAFCKLANPRQILARCVHFENFSINTIVLKAPNMMTELQTASPQAAGCLLPLYMVRTFSRGFSARPFEDVSLKDLAGTVYKPTMYVLLTSIPPRTNELLPCSRRSFFPPISAHIRHTTRCSVFYFYPPIYLNLKANRIEGLLNYVRGWWLVK